MEDFGTGFKNPRLLGGYHGVSIGPVSAKVLGLWPMKTACFSWRSVLGPIEWLTRPWSLVWRRWPWMTLAFIIIPILTRKHGMDKSCGLNTFLLG